MAKQTLTDFTLPKDAYAAFDAVSLKALIKQRLNDNSFFTGQNFEGSNMSAMLDVVAYSYHVLLFYLNQTSTETLFSEAELYENMNRIVKSLDYKPVGYQTSALTFESEALSTLPASTYTIPRYSFFNIGGTYYSFNDDVTFTKTINDRESLTDLSNKNLLYQGRFEEYPLFRGIGEEFETKVLLPGDDIIIDHFNIHVYIKDVDTGNWEEWKRTSSLFLERSTARAFEVRLNENKRYEIKFGNNVTGRQLKRDDQIAVYYLVSDGKKGEIGPGSLNRARLTKYESVQFVTVFDDVKDVNIKYITQQQMFFTLFTNSNASSEYYKGETVDDIRERAPKVFATQYRLVTKPDYENFLKQTYSNIIRDAKVVNNWDYLDGHFKYNVETLKLDANNKEPRTLLNQVNFADSCDFNNLYCYVVPRLEQITSGIPRSNYLSPAQKNVLVSGLRENKTLTTEVLITDPVYMAVDLGIYSPIDEVLTPQVKDTTVLTVARAAASTRSFESIQNATYKIITDYFKEFDLGSSLGLAELVTSILNLEGVNKVLTERTDTGQQLEGLNLLVWNPIYPEVDIITAGSDITLPYYKYPFLYDTVDFVNKINVVPESQVTGLGSTEY